MYCCSCGSDMLRLKVHPVPVKCWCENEKCKCFCVNVAKEMSRVGYGFLCGKREKVVKPVMKDLDER